MTPAVTTTNPSLNFNGTTEEAFLFYQSIFGGDFAMFQRFGDLPGAEQMPESERNNTMHVSLSIAPGITLMGSDVSGSMGHSLTVGNNVQLSVGADSKEDAQRLFDALSAGGTVTMPIADTFWGAFFGMMIGKFGTQWMVNFDCEPAAQG